VVTLLKRLGRERGTTTLMVTHDAKILDLADRIITLEEGRIIKDTAPITVLQQIASQNL
jgi:putative ABC transport system ATP-binding protein